ESMLLATIEVSFSLDLRRGVLRGKQLKIGSNVVTWAA
ncbi:hypothetical protein CEXT_612361, partial [Caerostris extrusa]